MENLACAQPGEQPLFRYSCSKEVTRKTGIFAAAFVLIGIALYLYSRDWRVGLLCLLMAAVFGWFTWQDQGKRIDVYEDRVVQYMGVGRFQTRQEILWEDVKSLREASSVLAAANTFYLADESLNRKIIIDSTLTDYIVLMRYCRSRVSNLTVQIRSMKIMMAMDGITKKSGWL